MIPHEHDLHEVANSRSVHWLQVDLLFDGVGGLDECPSEEYKVSM